MGYFTTLLYNRELSKHDGRNLWKYSLSDDEYIELVKILQYSTEWDLDPRDAAIYYAEWWRRKLESL